MSASDKKKLRKEQNVAAMTEKQRAEQKQQKKLKTYTISFIVVMVLVLAIVLGSVLQAPVLNLMVSKTTALTVGSHEISAAELNYFYIDAINNFYNTYASLDSTGSYGDLYVQIYTGLKPTTALDEQVYNSETGETWADYFTGIAKSNAKWAYAMYDKATAAGYTLSEDDEKSLTSMEAYLEFIANYGGYSSTDAYVRTIYGNGATLKSYMNYYKIQSIASGYASEYVDGLEYTDDDIRAYEDGKYAEYCSYSYAYYKLEVSNYLTGGTSSTDEDGKTTITYSDEEKAAAREAVLADAKTLVESGSSTVVMLNQAIRGLEKSKDDAAATEVTAKLYSSLSKSVEDMYNWVIDDERNAGDLTYIAITTTDADGNEVITGYYVVLFVERIDNTMNIGNVRHLLVAFKDDDGKTYSDGTTTFTDEQKAAAKEEAEALLEEYLAGDKTEEAFTTLLKEHTDDVDDDDNANNDGLYENITPDSGYVESFAKWATADHEEGDVEIIESVYGYHIMYYVGANELNYRDTMIRADMVEDDYAAWEETILSPVTTTDGNLKYIDRDLVISN